MFLKSTSKATYKIRDSKSIILKADITPIEKTH